MNDYLHASIERAALYCYAWRTRSVIQQQWLKYNGVKHADGHHTTAT